MMGSVRNSRQGDGPWWLVAISLVVVLVSACTVEGPDGPVGRDNTVEGPDDGSFRSDEGRGIGIPSSIRIEGNTIRQAANGLRIDAGQNLCIVENVIEGIDGAELRVEEGIGR